MWNRCGDNHQIANRDLKLKFISIISIKKAKADEEKAKTQTQVLNHEKSDFCDSAKDMNETNWSRVGLRLKSDNLKRGCRLQNRGAVKVQSESRQRVVAHRHGGRDAWLACGEIRDDDDCFYYHSWRNNVVIAFGTLSSFLTWLQ